MRRNLAQPGRRASVGAWTLLSLLTLLGCFASRPQEGGPSFATDIGPDTDGILVEWHNCAATKPCVRGEVDGASYQFHFVDSPSAMTGKLGAQEMHLALDPNSVYRLGDHAIELRFRDAKSGAFLDLTWNERDQRLIDHDLILP